MKLQTVGFVLSLALLAGCATAPYQPYAREVKKAPAQGGIIALNQNHRDEDRQKADYLMRQNCGTNAVKVTEEGEVITGQTTVSNAKKTNDQENQGGIKFGAFTIGGAPKDAENTATTATTTDVKEWRINYECVAQHTEAAPAIAEVPKPLKAGKKTASKK